MLFIGKAVRVLKQPMSSAASHQALRAHAEILGFSQALHQLQAAELFSTVQFDHCIETMRAKVGSYGMEGECSLHCRACALRIQPVLKAPL